MLKLQYPTLYNIVGNKQIIVATILSTIPLNVFSRSALVDNKLLELQHLVATIVNIDLHVGRYIFFTH
jgi:hypothetical protein